jgi:hypothetical protein
LLTELMKPSCFISDTRCLYTCSISNRLKLFEMTENPKSPKHVRIDGDNVYTTYSPYSLNFDRKESTSIYRGGTVIDLETAKPRWKNDIQNAVSSVLDIWDDLILLELYNEISTFDMREKWQNHLKNRIGYREMQQSPPWFVAPISLGMHGTQPYKLIGAGVGSDLQCMPRDTLSFSLDIQRGQSILRTQGDKIILCDEFADEVRLVRRMRGDRFLEQSVMDHDDRGGFVNEIRIAGHDMILISLVNRTICYMITDGLSQRNLDGISLV